MNKKQFKQLKQDPNLHLCFFGYNKKKLDDLYRINVGIEIKEKTNETEKKIYGVEFKKEEKIWIPIDIATNNKKELIYIIRFTPDLIGTTYSNHLTFEGRGIFFKDFESARNYLLEKFGEKANKKIKSKINITKFFSKFFQNNQIDNKKYANTNK